MLLGKGFLFFIVFKNGIVFLINERLNKWYLFEIRIKLFIWVLLILFLIKLFCFKKFKSKEGKEWDVLYLCI